MPVPSSMMDIGVGTINIGAVLVEEMEAAICSVLDCEDKTIDREQCEISDEVRAFMMTKEKVIPFRPEQQTVLNPVGCTKGSELPSNETSYEAAE